MKTTKVNTGDAKTSLACTLSPMLISIGAVMQYSHMLHYYESDMYVIMVCTHHDYTMRVQVLAKPGVC